MWSGGADLERKGRQGEELLLGSSDKIFAARSLITPVLEIGVISAVCLILLLFFV